MPTEMLVGEVNVPGIISVKEEGGQQAPEKKTEEGFSFTTHVDAQPRQFTVEAWVEPGTYNALTQLRTSEEPVPVYAGIATASTCVLDDLSVDETGSEKSHYKVTISLREIQQAQTGTASLSVNAGTGEKQGSSEFQDPTLVQTKDEGGADGGGEDQSPIDQTLSWLGIDDKV